MKHQDIVDLSGTLPHKGLNGTRPLSAISMLVVHHSATIYDSLNPSQTLISIANDHMNGSRYALISGDPKIHPDGIQYHFAIANGNIYKLAQLDDVKWHAGQFKDNFISLAVCVLGDYDVQPLDDLNRSALNNLVWMLSRFDKGDFTELMSIDTAIPSGLKAHCDIIPDACPGKSLVPIVHDLINTGLESGMAWQKARDEALTVQATKISQSTSAIAAEAPLVQTAEVQTVPVQVQPSISSDVQAQLDSLNGRLLLVTNNNSTLSENLQSANKNIMDLTDKLSTISTEYNSQVALNAALKTTIDNLNIQLSESEQKLASLENTNSTTNNNYLEVQQKDQVLNEKLVSLEDQLKNLSTLHAQNSTILENMFTGTKEFLARYGINI